LIFATLLGITRPEARVPGKPNRGAATTNDRYKNADAFASREGSNRGSPARSSDPARRGCLVWSEPHKQSPIVLDGA